MVQLGAPDRRKIVFRQQSMTNFNLQTVPLFQHERH